MKNIKGIVRRLQSCLSRNYKRDLLDTKKSCEDKKSRDN